jgi:MoxR-like ATPase
MSTTVGLVKRFNELNGASHRYGSVAMNDLVQRTVATFGLETIIEVIENVRGTTIYEVLSASKILDYKKSKGNPELTAQPQPKTESSEQSVTNAFGLIERAMAQVMVEKYAPQVAQNSLKFLEDFIKSEYGTINRKVEYKVLDKTVLIDTVHEVLDDVISLSQIGKAVYLSGPSGSGKNVIGSQVSKVLQLPFHFSNAIQQIYQLVGFIDANGRYHETEFYRAFTSGGVFFLDEMDASNPELLIWLNAAIANGYCEFPQGVKQAHDNFRIIGAGNTSGKGATEKYVTRQQLDMATLNRFIEVEVTYSKQVEDAIASDLALANFIRDYRKATEKIGYNTVVSYREITNIRDLINGLKWDVTKALKYALTKTTSKDDLRMIYGELSDKVNIYAEGVKKLCNESK